MFIQIESTPNPSTLKFLPGKTVLEEGTLDFRSATGAEKSPLAQRLFAIPGVTGVFFGQDFITVTADVEDWSHIKPAILGAIMEHFVTGMPILAEDAEEAATAMAGVLCRRATARWSIPSKSCWKRACARRWLKMAATSPSRGFRTALSI
jgi:hypothetical protein